MDSGYATRCILLCLICKAGRLVGLADCYSVIVLADNATFLLAVNRIAAFRLHSAIITNVISSSRGSAGRSSAHQSPDRGFESHLGHDFSTCLCHFGIHGRCGIILPRFWLRGQLQNRTALVKAQVSYNFRYQYTCSINLS